MSHSKMRNPSHGNRITGSADGVSAIHGLDCERWTAAQNPSSDLPERDDSTETGKERSFQGLLHHVVCRHHLFRPRRLLGPNSGSDLVSRVVTLFTVGGAGQ